MKNKLAAIILGGSILASGIGAGVAFAQPTPTPDSTPSVSAPATQPETGKGWKKMNKTQRQNQKLDTLAKKLGVSTDMLQKAFNEIRTENRIARQESLAKELGITVEELNEAMENHRGTGTGQEGLAKELGIPVEKLEEAMEAAKFQAGPHRLDKTTISEKLAEKLGLDQDEVQKALDNARPNFHQKGKGKYKNHGNENPDRKLPGEGRKGPNR